MHTSVIITIDLCFSECATFLGEAKLATASLDHITYRCHILETGNDSYRFKVSANSTKKRKWRP
jgi:hypothetical protein